MQKVEIAREEINIGEISQGNFQKRKRILNMVDSLSEKERVS